MRQLELQPAYILHVRPYRDTSAILDIFTLNHGRLSMIARGAKRPKHPWRHVLMPFHQLALSWTGRSELQTLVQAEQTSSRAYLQGDALFCGFYLNELLLYFLPKQDSYSEVFILYQQTLEALQSGSVEQSLRIFEKRFLALLGYEINFLHDSEGVALLPDALYQYQNEQGFIRLPQTQGHEIAYPGNVLLKIAMDSYDDRYILQYAKRLFRQKIQYHLGSKTLKSREVYF